MSRTFWIISLILFISVVGCKPTPMMNPTSEPSIIPLASDQEHNIQGEIIAKGTVVSMQEARMSFQIPGRIKEIAVTEGEQFHTGQTLLIVEAPDLEAAVREAEATLRAAQAQWEFWLLPRKGKGPEFRERAWAIVLQAQAALKVAQAKQAQARLFAPFDGTVILLNISKGEVVEPGQIIIVLTDLENIQIETTDLSERDIPLVKAGQLATIYIESFNQEIQGQVTQISPKANQYDGDVVYKVTIILGEKLPELRLGMSVEVNIQTEKSE